MINKEDFANLEVTFDKFCELSGVNRKQFTAILSRKESEGRKPQKIRMTKGGQRFYRFGDIANFLEYHGIDAYSEVIRKATIDKARRDFIVKPINKSEPRN